MLARTVSLALAADRIVAPQDAATSAAPEFWCGSPVRLRLAILGADGPALPPDLAGVAVWFKASPGGAAPADAAPALAGAETDLLNAALTREAWESGAAAHAELELPGPALDLPAGAYWLVVLGHDATGRRMTLGAGKCRLRADGVSDAALPAPPPVAAAAETAAEAAAGALAARAAAETDRAAVELLLTAAGTDRAEVADLLLATGGDRTAVAGALAEARDDAAELAALLGAATLDRTEITALLTASGVDRTAVADLLVAAGADRASVAARLAEASTDRAAIGLLKTAAQTDRDAAGIARTDTETARAAAAADRVLVAGHLSAASTDRTAVAALLVAAGADRAEVGTVLGAATLAGAEITALRTAAGVDRTAVADLLVAAGTDRASVAARLAEASSDRTAIGALKTAAQADAAAAATAKTDALAAKGLAEQYRDLAAAAIPGGMASVPDTLAGLSTAKAVSPDALGRALVSPILRRAADAGATTVVSGTGASAYVINPDSWTIAPPSSGAGYGVVRAVFRAASAGGHPLDGIDWRRRVIVAARLTRLASPGSASAVWRLSLGKTSSQYGVLSGPGVGVRQEGVGPLRLVAHNGAALTVVDTAFTPAESVAFDVAVISDGAGGVSCHVNGVLVGSCAGGPTVRQSQSTGYWLMGEYDTSATVTPQATLYVDAARVLTT